MASFTRYIIFSACLCAAAQAIIPRAESPPSAPPTEQTCLPLDPPATPSGLKAIPGNGNITLTWSSGSHSACIDYYSVTYLSIGPQGLKGQPFQAQTNQLNMTLTRLDNGVNYAFYVEPVNKRFNRTNPAMITAVPRAPCEMGVSPAPPTNLTAYSDGPGIKLCWKAPKPGGCVTEYRVAKKIVPLTEYEVQGALWQYQTVPTAGCMSFTKDMQDRRSYQFAVQSFSNTARTGAFASTQATVVRDWRCMPVEGYYPLCKAASSGKCNPMTCAQQKDGGMCSSPGLMQLDKTTKTVVQYCAEVCGCSIDVESAGRVQAEPQVQKLERNGYDNNPYGCCAN